MVPRIDPKHARYRLRLGPSRIHRFGVFALEEIPAGKHVIEYTGKRLTLAQAFLVAPAKEKYIAKLNDSRCIDPTIGGSGAEFINHSCKPNLEWRRSRGRLIYFSRRRIRIGEELTGNYRYPIKLKRIPCRCGARGCRKTLRYVLS
jgi:uncharacterized protein